MLRLALATTAHRSLPLGVFAPVFSKMAAYSHLVKDKALINGEWVSAANGATFDVHNPSTGAKIATLPDMGATETQAAIRAADAAFKGWRAMTGKHRCDLLLSWFRAISRDAEAMAALITAENGKCMADSTGETVYGNSFLEWFAAEARRGGGEVIVSPVASKRSLTLHQPIGPVGVITPWNFPHAMITRKVGAALAAGCSVVVKPAEDTPLTALALAHLAQEAGLPPGVLNVVPCSRRNTAAVGAALCEAPEIRCLSFTGSTEVGRRLLQQCAPTVKRVNLELGGHAPFIVFESGDVDKAVRGAMGGKFRCSGQTCVCPNRFFVHEAKYDAFLEALSKEVAKLVIGDGTKPNVSQGPLINAAAVDKVERHVKDAVQRGAKVLVGGRRLEGNFFEPTVLADCTADMLCFQEETFGPLAPVMKFTDEAEVMRLANSLEVGLAGYFFSEDLSQIWRVAENLEVGMVGVNEGMVSSTENPFGGVKQSGLGREGGSYGLAEFQEVKLVCMGNLA